MTWCAMLTQPSMAVRNRVTRSSSTMVDHRLPKLALILENPRALVQPDSSGVRLPSHPGSGIVVEEEATLQCDATGKPKGRLVENDQVDASVQPHLPGIWRRAGPSGGDVQVAVGSGVLTRDPAAVDEPEPCAGAPERRCDFGLIRHGAHAAIVPQTPSGRADAQRDVCSGVSPYVSCSSVSRSVSSLTTPSYAGSS